MTALDRAAVARVLAAVLPRVPQAEIRLVGTASSLARGIALPAGDVDILFRARADVDAWVDALRSRVEIDTAPAWLQDANQYFARVIVDGVSVELSTVEHETAADTFECIGAGPWLHYDIVRCGALDVPGVACELRLVTEFERGRDDRYRPIVEFLRVHGYDEALVRRGLTDRDTPDDIVAAVLADLRGPSPVEHLLTALEAQLDVAARIGVAELSLDSPCAGWTVRDVMNHSLGVTHKFADFADGTTDAPVPPPGDLLGHDHVSTVRAATARARAGMVWVDRSRRCRLPFGDFSADGAAGINLFDVLAHTWDMATGAGVTIRVADEVWRAGLDAARIVVGPEREGPQFGAQLAVDAGASPRRQFLAYLGRSDG